MRQGKNAMFDVLDRQTTLTGNQIKILAAAIIGDALEFFDYFLIGFVLAFLIGPWKLTFGQSAIVLLSSGVGAIIGAYVWGWLADRIGRRKVFIGTVLNFSIATGLLYFTPDNGWVYLAIMRFFVGVGVGGLYCVDLPLVQEFMPSSKRGWVGGIVTCVIPLGVGLGAVMGAFMGSDQWRLLFGVGVLPALLGVLAWLGRRHCDLRYPARRRARRRDGRLHGQRPVAAGVRDPRAARIAGGAGSSVGAGIAALALPARTLRGSAPIAGLGAADGTDHPAIADGRRRRPDHQEQLARPLQISAQPDRVLARQCRCADRRLRHHAVGAVAVRAAAEGDAAGSRQDDDPAHHVWLHRPPLLLVLLGMDGTAQRGRPARLRRGCPDHRGRSVLRRHAVWRIGVLADPGGGLLLRRRRFCHCRPLCGGGLALAPANFRHGLSLWLRRHRQDHWSAGPRHDRRLKQLPQAGRAAAPDSDGLHLPRLLVLDGRRGILLPRDRDPGQVDRADRQGPGRRA